MMLELVFQEPIFQQEFLDFLEDLGCPLAVFKLTTPAGNTRLFVFPEFLADNNMVREHIPEFCGRLKTIEPEDLPHIKASLSGDKSSTQPVS